MQIEKNVSLLPYNTFGINSSSSHFCKVTSLEDIKEACEFSRKKSLSKFILGGGSNILLTRDIEALTIKIDLIGAELLEETDQYYLVKFQAGETWHNAVLHCIEQGYAGLENLSLIPGNVGAAPMQNIGAYGMEIKERFHELEALNLETLEIEYFDAPACQFGYRESVFKHELKDKYIILNVTLKLLKEPEFNTSYGAIEQELEKMKVTDLSIAAVSQAVINIRQSKLPNPEKIGNAGSFFKNPVIGLEEYERLKTSFPELVAYPTDNDQMKLAAGWLIERSGWKGRRLGNCGVHDKQALVLVNHGGADGGAIFELSRSIQKTVLRKFGVTLEREVNVI